tara:strand:- start:890 stop:1828 length:939 start_codon:yes stop_codon:yes gene_type:complete
MEVIEGVALSELCDYSFGDQSGQWGKIYTSFMKDANLLNTEFVSKLFEVSKERNWMTLFVDNIRLYKRDIKEVKPEDKAYVDSLMETSDVLELCNHFEGMKFIIFTNLEDTPIDDQISVPDNVLCVAAINAVAYGGKVIPAPYGVQRKMTPDDDHIERLQSAMRANIDPSMFKLLYVNHNDKSHEERLGIKDLFKDKEWANVDEKRVDYYNFLLNLAKHKFIVCPRGNAIDCHRNWEVLYMRRVPVMKRDSYLEELYKDYPVLFVDKYSDITKDLLLENEHLVQQAKEMDLKRLTLRGFFDNIVNEYAFSHG